MGNSLKDLFDQAFSHLLSGEIKEASAGFEYIVNNSHIFGALASQIAQQKLLWYCIPLDAIFAEMEEYKFPVDIKSIIIRLFGTDSRYDKAEIESILNSIGDHLSKMQFYIRVGENFWVYRTVIEELANYVALDMENNTGPISLEAIFKKEWPDYCLDHPTFPDHFSEAALAEVLQGLHVRVLADKFVVSENLLPNALDAFARMIDQADQPLSLKKQITQLFPGLSASPEMMSMLENYLVLNLDNRFIEHIPGYYLTRVLLQFDTISFDNLFSNKYLPYSTEQLLKQRFPNLDLTQLTPIIHTLVQSQFLNNPHLVQIDEDSWFSRTRFDTFHSQIIQALSDQEGVAPLDDLIKQVAPKGLRSNHMYQFKEMILASLLTDNQAIQVTQTHWIHREKIFSLLEKARTYLLRVSRASIEKIISEVLNDKSHPTPVQTFYVAFEEYLCKDHRFLPDPNNRKVWSAIPKGQRDNGIIYKLLSESNFPLTNDEIVHNLQLIDPEYNLAADSRFKYFPNNRWGLSSWVWLNDYIYKYLLRTGKPLHENVVVGLVCAERNFRGKIAIFMPNEDPRFTKDTLNRWFCRYQLKPIDLDNLLAELDQYGTGRKLDVLFQKVLRLLPDATNACEILASDPRFICLDDLWYSRSKVFRKLSHTDIEKIYTYLFGLPNDSPPIPLKDIGLKAIGCDGRLTNASDLLSQDERFDETFQGFWVLSQWSSPDLSRTLLGSVAVHLPKPGVGKEDSLHVVPPIQLTKRKHSKGTKSLPEQKTYYHTLSQLDILHGNIGISGLLKQWIPETAGTILVLDNESNEFVAYVDETHCILNIRGWLQTWKLTYGDKLYIQNGIKEASLFIRPYGKRDQRVYQDAIQHQDIEKLIDEARRVNMTYHDLIIEVLEAFGKPLHREDIFQLVDYQRIATRNTIFEILSLTDCPYEELRYFISKDRGFWSFDRQRKKAFDMKMKELVGENTSLRDQIATLSERKEAEQGITARISQLNQKIQTLEQSIRELNNENTNLSARIQVLDAEKSHWDQFNRQLEVNLSEVQQHLTELTDKHTSTLSELENLRLEHQAFLENESQLQAAKAELERLRLEQKGFQDKTSQAERLQADLYQSQQRLVQIQSEYAQQVATLQEQVASIIKESDAVHKKLQQAETALANSVTQVADLNASRLQLQAELASHQAQAKLEISTLQAQLSTLVGQITILTNQFTAEHTEKQVIQAQFDQSFQEFQAFHEHDKQESAVLNTQIQKLVAELETRKAEIQALETKLEAINTEKIIIEKDSAAEKAQFTHEISAFQNQLVTLGQKNARQTQDLATLTASLKQLDHALATPLGRLFARFYGL